MIILHLLIPFLALSSTSALSVGERHARELSPVGSKQSGLTKRQGPCPVAAPNVCLPSGICCATTCCGGACCEAGTTCSAGVCVAPPDSSSAPAGSTSQPSSSSSSSSSSSASSASTPDSTSGSSSSTSASSTASSDTASTASAVSTASTTATASTDGSATASGSTLPIDASGSTVSSGSESTETGGTSGSTSSVLVHYETSTVTLSTSSSSSSSAPVAPLVVQEVTPVAPNPNVQVQYQPVDEWESTADMVDPQASSESSSSSFISGPNPPTVQPRPVSLCNNGTKIGRKIGSTIKLSFTGVEASLLIVKSRLGGTYDIKLDDKDSIEYDSYNADANSCQVSTQWSVANLDNKPHTIVVTIKGESAVVQGSAAGATQLEFSGLIYKGPVKPPSSSSSSGISKWAILGLSLGGVLLLAILAILICISVRRRRRQRAEFAPNVNTTPGPEMDQRQPPQLASPVPYQVQQFSTTPGVGPGSGTVTPAAATVGAMSPFATPPQSPQMGYANLPRTATFSPPPHGPPPPPPRSQQQQQQQPPSQHYEPPSAMMLTTNGVSPPQSPHQQHASLGSWRGSGAYSPPTHYQEGSGFAQQEGLVSSAAMGYAGHHGRYSSTSSSLGPQGQRPMSLASNNGPGPEPGQFFYGHSRGESNVTEISNPFR